MLVWADVVGGICITVLKKQLSSWLRFTKAAPLEETPAARDSSFLTPEVRVNYSRVERQDDFSKLKVELPQQWPGRPKSS